MSDRRVARGAGRLQRRAADYRQYLRERSYLVEVGPVVVTTWRRMGDEDQKAFELGRDYQRGVLSGKVES
jgi:hypothetical protein